MWNKEANLFSKIKPHKARVETVSFSPDGHRLASGSTDGTVRISDARTLEKIEEYSFEGPVLTCRFSPDGCTVYAAEILEITDHPNIHVLP
jgi:WD40 repeat protein